MRDTETRIIKIPPYGNKYPVFLKNKKDNKIFKNKI